MFVILEPLSFSSVVALEMVLGEHVVWDDVISFTELVPLGHEHEDGEEYECRHATYSVKHPIDNNDALKDHMQCNEDANSGKNNSAN